MYQKCTDIAQVTILMFLCCILQMLKNILIRQTDGKIQVFAYSPFLLLYSPQNNKPLGYQTNQPRIPIQGTNYQAQIIIQYFECII